MSDNKNYIVSARKYRPATFASVVGQKNLTTTLKNSISTGRLAQAYLFCGPRGVGKTSCARIFARTINCMNPTADGEACGECDSCVAISKGNSFNLIELDAASNNSVDDIRSLIEQVNIPPQQGKYKVFIIDEVHMLSSQAFNAFLKTLEEPPAYAIFILATTEKHKVIPTILSRCQIYDFKRITVDDMVEHLKYVASDRGVEADPRALGIVARKADGAMRDALSIFDQVAASSNGHITYESTLENLNVLDYDFYFRLIDCFANGDIQGALMIYKEIKDKGFDSLFFINGLASHVRDLMVAADSRTLPLLEVDSDTAANFKQQTTKLPLQWYYAAMKILNTADYNYRTTSNKQLLVEVTLIRLCQLLKPATPPFDIAEDLPLLRDFSNASMPEMAMGSTPASTEEKGKVDAPVASENVTTTQTAPVSVHSGPVSPEPTAQPAKRHLGKRLSSFRLSDMNKSEDSDDSSNKKSAEFTDEKFEEAWNVYLAQHTSQQQVLASAMRTASKKRLSPTEYEIEASTHLNFSAFEMAATHLVPFLREYLGNDLLNINFTLSQNEAAERKLSEQELLKKMMVDNPVLGDFLKALDIESASFGL